MSHSTGLVGEEGGELVAAEQLVRPLEGAGADVEEAGVDRGWGDVVQLCPGQPVDRQLKGGGGEVLRYGAGLVVDDVVTTAVAGIDRVDPAADQPAGNDELERLLHRNRSPLAPPVGEELRLQLGQLGIADVGIAGAGQVVRLE